MLEQKILVYYIGVAGIRSEDIEDYINRVAKKTTPSTFEGEIIFIPVQSINTTIDCINPKYITDENLIKEHTEMIKTLNEELQNQILQLNNKKDE